MKNNKPEKYNSKIIDDLLSSISPEVSRKIERKMLIAAKIDDALKVKGWKKKDLLKALDKKNPSIITKWLSGTHNFTLDTLIDLESVLDINLLDLEKKQEQVPLNFHIVLNQKVEQYESFICSNEYIKRRDNISIYKSGIFSIGNLTKQNAEA
ncbi:MAG: hypothetical protein K8R41_03820 [Bacteroidales bacterium]|nr:hypothetical protein [Bacteroidales bacterium]